MRRRNKKTYIFTILFFALSIGVAALALYFGDKGGKGGILSSYFTKNDMLEDYEYLWGKLEENWPYFYDAKENGVDLYKIKEKYRRKISSKPSDVEFYNNISNMLDEISSYNAAGKVYALDYYRQAFMAVEPRYVYNSKLRLLVNKRDTKQKYRYIETLLKIKPIAMHSIYELYGTNNKEEAKIFFDNNIKVDIIEKDKIAKIKINSMFLNEYSIVEKNIYDNSFRKIYKDLSSYENIIFDLTDCVGTSSYLWKRYIVMPNIDTSKQYDITCIYNSTKDNEDYYGSYFGIVQKDISDLFESGDVSYLSNFDSYFKYTVRVENSLYYKDNISKAKKWIITGKNTGLEANNFVNFAKETEFATIVGTNLGRLDVPLGVGGIRLPKSGLVVIYDGLQYLDNNGKQGISEIKADIEVTEDGKALEVCLDKIQNLIASGEYKFEGIKPVSSISEDIGRYRERIVEFDSFARKVNEKRKELALAELEDYEVDESYTPSFKDEKDVFSSEEINTILAKENSKAVTKEKAIQDIETLFKLYKYTYAAYYYFGGDATYNEAKKNIIHDIKEFDKEMISSEEFIELIAPHLRFVQDGHNSIRVVKNGQAAKSDIEFCEKHKLYISKDYDISCIDNKYHVKLDDKNVLIESFSGDNDLDKYIKSTIDDEGKLSYGLFSLFTSEKDADSFNTIIAIDGDKKITLDLSWELAKNASKDYMKIYEREDIEDIPVYSVHRMSSVIQNEIEILEGFPLSAVSAKDEKVFVIDLRGNGGGFSYYADEWYRNYTNQHARLPRFSFTKISILEAYMYRNRNDYNVEFPEFTDKFLDTLQWDKNINTKRQWCDNNNIIIVLIDNNVASASEIMMEYLSTIDNVIFIGSNSYGARLTGGITEKYLPNSKLMVRHGFTMHFFDNLENKDGKGYMPDIWVSPDEALDKAIKLCKYYGLNLDKELEP